MFDLVLGELCDCCMGANKPKLYNVTMKTDNAVLKVCGDCFGKLVEISKVALSGDVKANEVKVKAKKISKNFYNKRNNQSNNRFLKKNKKSFTKAELRDQNRSGSYR